jgi:2-C-methyl-D-erythritol 4-phosphate cytidylyltransferase
MSGSPSGEPVGAILSGTSDGIGVEEELLWARLAGRPVLAWSLQALLDTPRVTAVTVLVRRGREAATKELVDALPARGADEISIVAVPSGFAAADSIREAVESLSPAFRLLVLHQGNHPLVTAGSIELAIATAENHPDSVVVAAGPVSETIKRTSDRLVIETPPRAVLRALGTPHVFPHDALLRVLRSPSDGSGPPRRLEPIHRALAAGMRILPVTFADRENLPITRREDLLLAEVLLLGSR